MKKFIFILFLGLLASGCYLSTDQSNVEHISQSIDSTYLTNLEDCAGLLEGILPEEIQINFFRETGEAVVLIEGIPLCKDSLEDLSKELSQNAGIKISLNTNNPEDNGGVIQLDPDPQPANRSPLQAEPDPQPANKSPLQTDPDPQPAFDSQNILFESYPINF